MTLSPVATPAAGTVTAIVVPVVALAFVPMFLTNAMPARASEAARGSRSASVTMARRARFLGGRAVIAREVGGRQIAFVMALPVWIAKRGRESIGNDPEGPRAHPIAGARSSTGHATSLRFLSYGTSVGKYGTPSSKHASFSGMQVSGTETEGAGARLLAEHPDEEVGERKHAVGAPLLGERRGEGGGRVVVTGDERGDRRRIAGGEPGDQRIARSSGQGQVDHHDLRPLRAE